MLEELKKNMGSAVFWQTATFIVVTMGLMALIPTGAWKNKQIIRRGASQYLENLVVQRVL